MANFWKGDEEQQASTVVICESTMDVSGSHENSAWRGYGHSCNRAVDSGCRGGNGGSFLHRPAQGATFSDFLSAECDRLRGGSESLGSDDVDRGGCFCPRPRSRIA